MPAWLHRAIASLCALAAIAALVPAAASAQGDRRIVVEHFRGPRAGRLRSMLIDDLQSAGWEVVDEGSLRAAVRDLDLSDRRSEDEYVQLARRLQARAIVTGTVARARRSWRLTVRVRNGADGRVLGTEAWGGHTAGSMDGVARSGASRLRAHLDQARGPSPPRAVTVVASPPGEEPWYLRRHLDDERLPDDEDGGNNNDEQGEPADAERRHDAFRISVSAGSVWRSLRALAIVYAARRGQPTADPSFDTVEETRSYTSSGIGHAELGIEAEIYPGALGDQGFPWLGLLVSFRHSVGLTSFGCRRSAMECAGAGRVQIGTDQMDLEAGARARYRFGERRGDFELHVEALWGLSTFSFDTRALQEIDFDSIIPPMEYQYLHIGGGFSVGHLDWIVLDVRAAYRPGLALGAKAREVWGTETGPASGYLLGLELRHGARWIAEGLFLALRVEYFQFQTVFRGQVGCAEPDSCPPVPPDELYRDPNLWEPWPVDRSGQVVGGLPDPVTDHYVRWGIYLGYAFR
jgi:hypothetical protein